jgi:hypothetical protein
VAATAESPTSLPSSRVVFGSRPSARSARRCARCSRGCSRPRGTSPVPLRWSSLETELASRSRSCAWTIGLCSPGSTVRSSPPVTDPHVESHVRPRGGGRMSDQLVTVASKSSALGAAALEPKPQSFQASTRTNRNASFATGAKTPCFMLRPHRRLLLGGRSPSPGTCSTRRLLGRVGCGEGSVTPRGVPASVGQDNPRRRAPRGGLRPLMANFGRYWVRTRRCVRPHANPSPMTP